MCESILSCFPSLQYCQRSEPYPPHGSEDIAGHQGDQAVSVQKQSGGIYPKGHKHHQRTEVHDDCGVNPLQYDGRKV